jgi:hypothetical protein
MQLTKRHNHVSSNGNIGEQSNFNIAVNAKMFRVLSDTMYQDKIGSIVREISCNAKDAHTEAGTPKLPFVIHIPNAFEPWFSVKDFGTGMSDTDVRELYTTYGESTRDQTNEVTGGFGLGSKTPFAYTDQFTIISIFDGMQRTYVAVINDEGLPVLNLQDERESSEHVGLEIHMAVENNDFDAFRTAITKQLRFFRVKPTLENNMNGTEFTDMSDEDCIEFQNDDLIMYKSGYSNPIKDLYVVQGEVGYPVDIDLLEGITDEVKEFATAIDKKGAWFEVPIGIISVTANREGISYEPDTITSIISELHRISTSICKIAIDEINAEKLVWEKCVIFNAQITVIQNAIVSSVGDLSKIMNGAVRATKTKRMALKLDKMKLAGLKVVQFGKHEYRTRGGSYSERDWRLSKTELSTPTIDNNTNWNSGSFLYPSDHYHVFIRDTNSKPIARLKLYAEENNFPQMLIIESLFGGSTEAIIKNAAVALGISESRISKMSDLETPAVSSNGTPSGKRARGYEFKKSQDTHNSKGWKPVMDLDELGVAVYVEMERHCVDLDDDARQALNMARAGRFDFPVVAVNQQTFKRIQKGKVGTTLITPTEALAPIKENVKSLVPAYIRFLALDCFCKTIENSTALWWMEKAKNNQVSSDIFVKVKKLRAKAESIKATYEEYEYHINQVADVDVSKATHKAQEAAERLANRVDAKYPMLEHLNRYRDDAKMDAINYINLVDNAC